MLPGRTRLRARDESSDEGSSGSRLRRVVVALGVVAATVYAVRRFQSGGGGGDRPRAQPIDIDASEAAGEDDEDGGGASDEAGGGEIDLDRETVEERAVEDAGEVPAEPGEMEVAEELAEEALDEDVDATPPDDESPGPDPEDAETGE